MYPFFRGAALALLLALPVGAASLTVGGSVRTVDGVPLAEARVELRPLLPRSDWVSMVLAGLTAPEPAFTSFTDASGRFCLEAPNPGMWMVAVQAAGFVPMRFDPLPLVAAAELPPVTLQPDAGTRIEIVDGSDSPAARSWAFAKSVSQALWSTVATDGWRVGARFGLVDARGRLTLPRAKGERLTIRVAAPGSVPVTSRKHVERTVRLLRPKTELRRMIEIVDVEGEPLAGILVAAGDLAWPVGRTGQDGRLNLAVPSDGPIHLHLFAEDGQYQTGKLEPAAQVQIGPTRFVFAFPEHLAGKVIAADDHRPLAGALVWAAQDPGAYMLTDTEGGYELPTPASGRFSIRAIAAGFHSGATQVSLPGGSNRVSSIALTAAEASRGQVVDIEGSPLPGVAVAAIPLFPVERLNALRRDRADSRAVSDSGGQFLLENLVPDASYEIAAAKEGFFSAQITFSGAWRDEAREKLRIVLKKACPAHGRLLDGEEWPVAGAEVELVATSGSGLYRPTTVTTSTDEMGRFQVAAVPSPRFHIEVRKNGFQRMTVRGVEIAPGEGSVDLGTLILISGASLTGVVTTASGEPLAEASVWVAEGEGKPTEKLFERIRREEERAVSGPAGRFRVEDLRPGKRVHLVIDHEGYLPAWVLGVAAPSPDILRVVLRPAASVSGQVIDGAGEPIPRSRVMIREQKPSPGAADGGFTSNRGPRVVVADAQGGFQIGEVTPGKVDIEAFARGFQPSAPLHLEIPTAQEIKGLNLVLERGAVLEGVVSAAEGEPVMSARIEIGRALASSDMDGFYRLEGVAPGRHLVAVRHQDYRSRFRKLEIESRINVVDFVLWQGESVTGRVVEESEVAVEGARLRLHGSSAGEVRRYETVSRADGRFRFPAVAPGLYDLETWKRGYATDRTEGSVRVANGPVKDLEVRLRRGTAVVGRVLGLDFDEMAMVQVEAEGGDPRNHRGTVDYQGRYEIADLGPGDWLIRAYLPGGSRQAEVRLTVEPGTERLERDLELGRGLILGGHVFYEGAPLSGTRVSLTGFDVAAGRSVVTDHQGGFRLEDLAPGRYRLALSNHPQRLIYNRDLELLTDLELPIEITPVRLHGTVISATNSRPLPDSMVAVQQLPGQEGTPPGSLITTTTDPEGSFILARLTPSRYRVAVRKDGYAPAEQLLELAAGGSFEGLEFTLSPTEGLDIVVRLADGLMPSMVTLSLLDASGRLALAETRSLSQDGFVHFPTVPPGTWGFLVSAPGAVSARAHATVPGAPIEVLLTAATRLEARVPALAESNLVAILTLHDQSGHAFQGVEPNGALRYQWALPSGRGTVEGIPAGIWTLRAIAPNGQSWQQTITIAGLELSVSLE